MRKIVVTGIIGMLIVLFGAMLFLLHADGYRIVMAAGWCLELIAVICFSRHLARSTSGMTKIIITGLIGMLLALAGVWLFVQHANGARTLMMAGMLLELVAFIQFVRRVAQPISGRKLL